MFEENEKESFITLNFSGTEKKFADIDELREFMQHQYDAWSWLQQVAQKDPNLFQVWNLFNIYFVQIDSLIEWYNSQPKQNQAEIDVVKRYKNTTRSTINQGFILDETPIACFVSNIRDKESPEIAGYTLALLINVNLKLNTAPAYKGSYWAMQYLSGFLDDPTKPQQEIFGSIIERQITQQANDLKDFVNGTKNEISNFKTYCIEKIALQSPAKYWSTKRTNHQNAMRLMAVVTIFVAVLSLWLFVLAAVNFHEFKDIFGSIIGAPRTSTESELLGIVKQISILLAISTIGVWLTRLSTKIFISNLHLKMDAEERHTMFQAYIALLSQDKGLNEDNRQLILQSLFRPSTTGFIKDEGPTSIPEALAKGASQQLKK